jgi:hypothetical protein
MSKIEPTSKVLERDHYMFAERGPCSKAGVPRFNIWDRWALFGKVEIAIQRCTGRNVTQRNFVSSQIVVIAIKKSISICTFFLTRDWVCDSNRA